MLREVSSLSAKPLFYTHARTHARTHALVVVVVVAVGYIQGNLDFRQAEFH